MKTIIEVEIQNIKVDERYYSFDYVITVNGKKGRKQVYESDYENGDTPKQWKRTLEKGYAVEMALQDFTL